MKINTTWTRVLAIAMSFVLLIGSMSVMTVSAATAITITPSSDYHNGSDTQTDIYVVVTPDTGSSLYGGSVSVNGTALESSEYAFIYGWASGDGCVQTLRIYKALTTGDVVILSGEFSTWSGSTQTGSYTAEESAMICTVTDGTYNWETYEATPSLTDLGEITLGVNAGIAGDNATVYVTASQSATVDANWSISYVGADDESGMFLNGETKLDGARICFIGWGNAMQFGGATIEAGQTVTVKGKFVASNANDTFTVKEVVFAWDGNTWTASEPSAAAQSVTLTPNNVTGTWAANVLYLSVSPKVVGTLPAYNSFTAVDGVMTVNGETAPSSVKMLTSWDGATNSIWYIQNTAGDFADGDIVTISGTWELNGVTVDIAEVSFQWKDSAWAIYTPPAAAQSVTLAPSNVTGTWAANVLYLSVDPPITGTFDNYVEFTADGGTIMVNGEERSAVKLLTAWSGGTVYMQNTAGDFADGDIVTISGIWTVGDARIDVAELTVQWKDSAWAEYVPPVEVTADELVISSVGWSDGASLLQFKLESGTRTGSESMTPAEATGAYAAGSVKLSGNAIASPSFTFTDNATTIMLTGISAAFVEGATIEISGLFSVSDGTYVNFATPFIAIYSGGTWSKKVDAQSVAIESISNPTGTWSNNIVYIKIAPTVTGTLASDAQLSSKGGTITVNGESSSAFLAHGWSNNYFYINGIGASEGDVVTISGQFQNGDVLMDVAEISLQWNGSSTGWTQYVEPTVLAKPELTLSGSTVSWVAVENATNYEVYINGSKAADTTATSYSLSSLGLGSYTVTVKATGGANTVAAESDAITYTLAATDVTLSATSTFNATTFYLYINGATVSEDYLWNSFAWGEGASVKLNGAALNSDRVKLALGYNGGMLYVQLIDDTEFAAGDTLTVSGIWSLGGVYINVAEATWLYSGSSWAVPVEPTVSDITLSDYTYVAPTSALFYVKASTAALPVGSYQPQGKDSGVWYNGVRLTDSYFEIGWTNEDGGTASGAIVRFGAEQMPVLGDKVTVKGEFVNGSDCGEINEVSFWYDGTYWTTTEVVLTKGDLNNNNAIDICDVVLMKITVSAGSNAMLGATDMDKDGDADNADLTVLRKIVLGYTYVDGVLLDKYSTAETVQLFADGGPVPYAGHIGLGDNSGLDAYFGAGFNTFIMTEDYTANNGDDDNTTIYNATTGEVDADYAAAIRLAQQYGDVMVRGYNSASYFDNNLYAKLYDLGVRKFYLWDEPTTSQMSELAGMLTAFNSQLPSDVLMHVNLLPSYGEKGIESGDSWWDKLFGSGTTYEDYVDSYVSDVMSQVDGQHTISVDNYPLMNSGSGNYLRETYLKDLWVIADRAKTNDPAAIVNCCIQAFEYVDTDLRTPETLADIRFQTNTGLALGAESFEYFMYYTWPSESATMTGLVNNGLYDIVKQANTELLAWDSVYLSFDWQGVKAYNVASAMTSGVTQLSSLQDVSVSATAATLVGEYKYGSADEYAYMITNFTEPSAGTTDTVTVTMAAGQTALVYINGVGSWMTADASGNLQLTLQAGEGAFVIPQ